MDWADSWVKTICEDGYEVWLMTQRGMEYADTNTQDGVWSLKEKWDFTWTDQGVVDIPAQLEVALEVTGKAKATLMGYSQGSAALWYGLAKRQAWYAERTARAILMAGCIY